jgi:hypothetical protein
MNRRARTEQRLREALDDPAGIDPSGADHGYLARSLVGAVSTLPYMGYASMGIPGFTAVALDMMQQLDDRIAADGGDVHGQGLEWAARKAVYGGLYAAIERLSALPVFRETGDIALKTAFLKLATRHGAAAAEKVALHVGKETFKETLEEAVQAVIEEHAASVGLGRGPGWADAARAGVREFAETAGTMGFVALAGTAARACRRAASGAAPSWPTSPPPRCAARLSSCPTTPTRAGRRRVRRPLLGRRRRNPGRLPLRLGRGGTARWRNGPTSPPSRPPCSPGLRGGARGPRGRRVHPRAQPLRAGRRRRAGPSTRN